jgi:hypothetical protein
MTVLMQYADVTKENARCVEHRIVSVGTIISVAIGTL